MAKQDALEITSLEPYGVETENVNGRDDLHFYMVTRYHVDMTTGRVRPEATSPDSTRLNELVRCLSVIDNADDMRRFLTDLCTVAELDAMGQRLQVAALVDEGVSYQEISKLTGASTSTVTRVAHWLRYGEGGYRVVLAGKSA